jgi:hypothetical protein
VCVCVCAMLWREKIINCSHFNMKH